MALTRSQVAELYTATFNRAPDAAGLAYWISDGTSATTSLTDAFSVATAMQESAEAGSGVNLLSDTDYVISLYSSMFGRTVDATDTGVAYWVAELASETSPVDRASMITTLISGAQASTGSATDAAVLANKTTVGLAYADAGLTGTTFSLASITADTATVTAAQASIDLLVSPAQALTTATTDTLLGTVHNDTFTGTSATIAATDLILDTSSTDNDTFNMTLTANNAALRVTGVENVNVDWNAFGTAGIVATNISGATITGTSTKTGFLGHMTITNAGANTIVAGSGMVGTLTVNGGTSVTVDAGAAHAVVVNGTGTAADDLSATVTAGTNTTSVTVGTTNAFKTTTVDAGTATTISIADQGAAANVTTLTVGASAAITLNNTGSTTLNVNAADVTSSLTLTAIGEGLTVAGAQSTTINATAAGYTGETITNALTAGTLTAEINGAVGADTNLSLVEAGVFVIDTAIGGDFAVAVATGSSINADINLGNGEFGVLTADDTAADTLTITNSVATQTIIQVDGLDATLGDIETLNLIAAATAVTGTDLTITDIEAGTGTVVITGTNDVVVTEVIAGTVNASGLTGNLTMTQQAADTAAMVVSGATATNSMTFTATANDSSYTGQNGNDTVVFVNDAGNATAILGNGANTVTASAGTTGSLVVIGGEGVDTVTASTAGDGTGEINLALGAGNDVMSITTGAAATTNILTIDAGAGSDALTLSAASVAADTYTLAFGDGTDTLNISTDLTAGTWSVTGLEKIAIGSSNTLAIVNSTLLTGHTYEITGDGTATDHIAVQMDAAASVDFSGIAVNQTITLGLAGLAITGSTGNDTIVATGYADTIASNGGNDSMTGGAGQDTITGGAGIDTIVFASGDAGTTSTTIDFVAAFKTAAADKLSLGTAGTTTNYAEVDIAAATDDVVTAALAAANTALDGTVMYAVIENSLDTNVTAGWDGTADAILFVDFDLDGTADLGVQMTGVLGAGLVYTDIIA